MQIFTIGVRLNALLEPGDVDPRLAEDLQHMRQLTIEASDEVRRAIFSLSGSDDGTTSLTTHEGTDVRLVRLLPDHRGKPRASGVDHIWVIRRRVGIGRDGCRVFRLASGGPSRAGTGGVIWVVRV